MRIRTVCVCNPKQFVCVCVCVCVDRRVMKYVYDEIIL